MKFLSSLDAKDRRLLLWCVGIGFALAVLTGFLLPSGNNNDNPLPSTYLSGQHGARAAYETLLRSDYPIERWERPLSELAATAGPETVVIFAEPFTRESADIKAVRTILERGGRVLSTGYWGGFILPGEASDTPKTFNFAACKLEPEGLDPLSGSGEVWMVPEAAWQVGNPAQRVEYSCAGQPAVVEYDWGKGHVVWWASSTPLENGSLARAHNLDLLLNSLGPREGHHFYWDESLHGEIRSVWSYAAGPALNMLWIGLAVLGAAGGVQLQPPQRAGARSALRRRAPRPSSFLRRWARSTATPEPRRRPSRLPGSASGGTPCGSAGSAPAKAMGAAELAGADSPPLSPGRRQPGNRSGRLRRGRVGRDHQSRARRSS